jgi:transposase
VQSRAEDYDHIALVAKPITVTRVRLHHCRCAACGAAAPAVPPADMPRGSPFGRRLRALIVLMRHRLDTPLDRLRQFLAEALGLDLAKGTICAMAERATASMTPAYEAVKAEVRASPVIASDETGMRFAGDNAYVWAFGTPSGDTVVFVPATRQKQTALDFLNGVEPEAWVSDRYAGQCGLAQQPQVCLPHLRRDCVRAIEGGDQVFAPALEAVVLTIMRLDALKPGWSPATLARRHRQVETALDVAMARQPHDREGRTLRRWVAAHRERLTLCLRRPDVPATNNVSERNLRPLVVGRKVSGGHRSRTGAQASCTIRSIVVTARRRSLNVFEALASTMAGGVLPAPASAA